ncbi:MULTISPECIES: hypothetical protein [unclassified Microbacterium]|uniref:hypothetical protein n=1 Tax=unclassified Microbacterium TaxID=2609290 RepID=UPI000493820B|nr:MULTISPECIES: hypothetical protein [unclassified Microbacterium]
MTESNLTIPPDDGAGELTAHFVSSLVELVPGVGPTAARAIDYKMTRRKAARDREFMIAVVAAIKELWEKSEKRPPIEEVFDSDEYLAAFERCSRVASESASDTKRARLARAAATAVLGDIKEAEIEMFLELTERYSDVHVWLLAFYCDPAAWLEANGMGQAAAPGIRGGKRDEPLQAALRVSPMSMSIVKAAVEDLQRDMMLVSFDLNENVGDRQQFAPQTRRRARRFLRFIGETGLSEGSAST